VCRLPKSIGEEEIRAVLSQLPVGVNCQLGDPFQPDQEPNTLEKLTALERAGHQGPVALLTKWDVSDETLDRIARFRLDIFMFYSITGLRESSVHGQEAVLRSYLASCHRLPRRRVAIYIRPIIPGKNDRLSIITPLLDAAEQGQGLIIARGFRDRSWNVLSNESFMAKLAQEAGKRGMRMRERTACLVAEVHGAPCKIHGDVLNELGLRTAVALGYDVVVGHGRTGGAPSVRINAGSGPLHVGDVHFVQLLAGVKAECDNCLPGNRLSVVKGPRGILLDCSSSWFTLANNTPCQVGCFYCQCAYRQHAVGEVGCAPVALWECLPRHAREFVDVKSTYQQSP